MINRTDPDYSFYKLTQSWYKQDPLNIPEIGGQMYIGLLETKEYKDGSTSSRFIDFDPAYVNGKIDYYNQNQLEARKDMPQCVDRKDFQDKIRNSNGLTMSDFDVMKCIPPANFELYNVAGTSDSSSITLLFEECGGKYQKSKEFESVIKEEAIAAALDAGRNPDLIVIEPVVWEWEKPDCDPSTEDCGYGLEEPPVVTIVTDGTTTVTPSEPTKTKIVYEDCTAN